MTETRTTHPHGVEERHFGGVALWDAAPDVCCAAFQLGACAHTEAWDEDDLDVSAIDGLVIPDHIDTSREPF